MQSLTNRDYYLSRADDARARAEAAQDPRVASLLLRLADTYDELAALVSEQRRPLST